jgi:hypothetical protein
VTDLLWTLALPCLILACLAVSEVRSQARRRRKGRLVGASIAALRPDRKSPPLNAETAGFLAYLKSEGGWS